MRIPQSVLLWLGGVAIGVAFLCVGLSLWRWGETPASRSTIPDLGKTKPLNQPGANLLSRRRTRFTPCCIRGR